MYGSFSIIDDNNFDTKFPISNDNNDDDDDDNQFLKSQFEFSLNNLKPFLSKLLNIRKSMKINELNDNFKEFQNQFYKIEIFDKFKYCDLLINRDKTYSRDDFLHLIKYLKLKSFIYQIDYRIFLYYDEKLKFYLQFQENGLKNSLENEKISKDYKILVDSYFEKLNSCFKSSLEIINCLIFFFSYKNEELKNYNIILIPLFLNLVRNVINIHLSFAIRIMIFKAIKSEKTNDCDKLERKLELDNDSIILSEIFKQIIKMIEKVLKILEEKKFRKYYWTLRISVMFSFILKLINKDDKKSESENENQKKKGKEKDKIFGFKITDIFDVREFITKVSDENEEASHLLNEYDFKIQQIFPNPKYHEAMTKFIRSNDKGYYKVYETFLKYEQLESLADEDKTEPRNTEFPVGSQIKESKAICFNESEKHYTLFRDHRLNKEFRVSQKQEEKTHSVNINNELIGLLDHISFDQL
ncbi:uncharacterized protein ASCRUDRAFT_76868 [Ascoidea rubescens DSM 1968]|uniref:Uncharacterized protein n=1 Tax=Ascoidea rubescens DSM 1968 TaxID=1344418 RepID=A0A1D2VEB5_9ASCO|nr:hypothetical protein ASCRUDRAFT_76868 [Ascoidea rubescens DSM 1968]ODV59949.1 hypothetical protein ASCRUDRAFT_76868 [Ascoidea rubescens DSM 1968]